MTDPTPQQILDTPMTGENDAGALTVRGYLLSLLAMLWIDGEGFSAKRPFGNSGWQWDVYAALGEAGHIAIKFDENGDVEDVNEEAGERLIRAAIGAIDVPTSPAELTEAQRLAVKVLRAAAEDATRMSYDYVSGHLDDGTADTESDAWNDFVQDVTDQMRTAHVDASVSWPEPAATPAQDGGQAEGGL